jgi:hypothetical protein
MFENLENGGEKNRKTTSEIFAEKILGKEQTRSSSPKISFLTLGEGA